MKKGEIWTVELPSSQGREQAGARPALILSVPEASTIIIVPFTLNIQALRFPHTVEVEATKRNGLSTNLLAG